MARGKRVARDWFIASFFGTLGGGGTRTESRTVLEQPEGNLTTGVVRLTRVIGLVGLYFENLVAGTEREINVWHGMVLVDDEIDAGTTFVTDNEDANMSWLWREPIVVFPTGKAVGAAGGDDWVVQARFDWTFRSGKGSALDVGKQFRYVITTFTTGQFDRIDWRSHQIQLFSAS